MYPSLLFVPLVCAVQYFSAALRPIRTSPLVPSFRGTFANNVVRDFCIKNTYPILFACASLSCTKEILLLKLQVHLQLHLIVAHSGVMFVFFRRATPRLVRRGKKPPHPPAPGSTVRVAHKHCKLESFGSWKWIFNKSKGFTVLLLNRNLQAVGTLHDQGTISSCRTVVGCYVHFWTVALEPCSSDGPPGACFLWTGCRLVEAWRRESYC